MGLGVVVPVLEEAAVLSDPLRFLLLLPQFVLPPGLVLCFFLKRVVVAAVGVRGARLGEEIAFLALTQVLFPTEFKFELIGLAGRAGAEGHMAADADADAAAGEFEFEFFWVLIVASFTCFLVDEIRPTAIVFDFESTTGCSCCCRCR